MVDMRFIRQRRSMRLDRVVMSVDCDTVCSRVSTAVGLWWRLVSVSFDTPGGRALDTKAAGCFTIRDVGSPPTRVMPTV